MNDPVDDAQQATGVTAIECVLRIAIFLQAGGVAIQYLFDEFEVESSLFAVLLYEWEWSQAVAQRVDDLFFGCWLAAGTLIVLLPLAKSTFGPRTDPSSTSSGVWRAMRPLEWTLLAGLFTLQLIDTWATWHRGTGEQFNALVFWERAARWSLPLVLALLLPRGSAALSARRVQWAMWLARLAVAITFVAHGVKALDADGDFVDYLIAASSRLGGWWPPESIVHLWLKIIGVVDLGVAVLILLIRSRVVALYMALWALIAAWSRVVHSGTAADFEVIIRSGNYCLPLAVALYFHYFRADVTTGSSEGPTTSEDTTTEIVDAAANANDE